jgi:hypothetical protein
MYNIIGGAPEGRMDEKRRWTRLECGKRGQGARQHWHLERRKALYDAVEPTLGLEIAKRVVGTSLRLQESGDWLLWKCRPPPKRNR